MLANEPAMERPVPASFIAKHDTYMKASPFGLQDLLDDEKIPVIADGEISANLISETSDYYYVELGEHMSGNWRKLWYLLQGDWRKLQGETLETGSVQTLVPDEAKAAATDLKMVGHIDLFSESVIAGWVYYVAHTEMPVTLDFYFDERLIGSTVSDLVRADVKAAGHETDRCGFRFEPPVGTFAPCETIELRTPEGQTFANRSPSA